MPPYTVKLASEFFSPCERFFTVVGTRFARRMIHPGVRCGAKPRGRSETDPSPRVRLRSSVM